MKRVFFVAMLLLLCSSSNASEVSSMMETGDDVLRICGASVKKADGLSVSDKEILDAIFCLAYLSGFQDSIRLSISLFKPQNQIICLPEKASSIQLARIVTKWLKDHPQQLHESGRMLVLFALGDVFPCK
jgi:hypothetical protein